MTLTPLSVACPQCGSADVVYSCQPQCCFNHVCNNCYTTFELETTRVGEVQEAIVAPPEPDPSGPTAPCARCGEATVFAIVPDGGTAAPSQSASAGRYVCGACKALLTLELTAIAPG